MIEVEKWLHSRIGLNFRSGLGRMQRAVDLLGNPEQTYPIIHVTGTNGKGSTIAFMRELLLPMGKRLAPLLRPTLSASMTVSVLMVSLYRTKIYSFSRSSQSNGAKTFRNPRSAIFFELLTLIALLYFKEQK